MGAKMMPMMKNKGRTVLGVRMGLSLSALYPVSAESLLHTATPSSAVAGTRYLSR